MAGEGSGGPAMARAWKKASDALAADSGSVGGGGRGKPPWRSCGWGSKAVGGSVRERKKGHRARPSCVPSPKGA